MKACLLLAVLALLPCADVAAQDDRPTSVELFWTADNPAALYGSGTFPRPIIGRPWELKFASSAVANGFTLCFLGHSQGFDRLRWFGTHPWILVDPTSVLAIFVSPLHSNGVSTLSIHLPNDRGLIGADVFLQALALDNHAHHGRASNLLWSNLGQSPYKGKAQLGRPMTVSFPHALWDGSAALFRNSERLRSVRIEGTAEGPVGSAVEFRTAGRGSGLLVGAVKPGSFNIGIPIPPGSPLHPGLVFPWVKGMTKLTFRVIIEK